MIQRGLLRGRGSMGVLLRSLSWSGVTPKMTAPNIGKRKYGGEYLNCDRCLTHEKDKEVRENKNKTKLHSYPQFIYL